MSTPIAHAAPPPQEPSEPSQGPPEPPQGPPQGPAEPLQGPPQGPAEPPQGPAEPPQPPPPGGFPPPSSGALPPPGSPAEPAAPRPKEPPPPTLGKTLGAAALTTAVVTLLSSRLVPDKFAATLVGLAFLAATWFLVLQYDEKTIQAYGLSMGGLLEPAPLSLRRLARDAASSLAWVLLFCAIIFPPFWAGYRAYWHVHGPFVLRLPPSILDEITGQLLVIALPEEAFFRGFLQTALDQVWLRRVRILGADVGPGLVVSAAIFAIGHLLTTPHQPARLAVFFPALLFGWLRARTRGIGAGVAFHAACNIFSATLARGYGLP